MQAAADRGVDWFAGRIAASDRFSGDLPAIHEWSFADILEAHMILDVVEDVQALYRPEKE